MQFLIADTFTDSLAGLSAQEQKIVKTTAFDLQLDPARPSHQLHRIERCRDPNFWSVRANQDIRLIVHKTAASFLLCYVDHHDAAYRWAERRRIETHPKTGAAQIVETTSTVDATASRYRPWPPDVPVGPFPEPKPPTTHQPEPQARFQPPIFHDLSRDDILAVGVPEDWVAAVADADADSIFRIAEHIPDEATEALLDYVVTGKLVLPAQADAAAALDPFAHPDAQRRFRLLANVDELKRALNHPWERWTVFLHPAQRRIAEQDCSGPARVAGSAGTGKSVVALHRAAHLARRDGDARLLVTTFSRTLAKALRVKLRRLLDGDHATQRRITVATVADIGADLYGRHFGTPTLASRADIEDAIRSAAADMAPDAFPLPFLIDEWDDVVDAWGLRTWEAYRDVARLGRKTRIGGRQRQRLWQVFAAVIARLEARSLVTTATTFARVADRITRDGRAPFDHVIVDEAQDVSVPELRFLAALGRNRADGLFFTGDLGQRIFRQPFSWKALGVDIRGRSQTLRINYRTSHQIRSRADRLLPAAVSDVDGNRESRLGTQSVFNGPPPVVSIVDDPDAEAAAVAAWIDGLEARGVVPGEIGIFVRSRDQIARAHQAVAAAGLVVVDLMESLDVGADAMADAVAVGTMHLAKGLEFKAVAVMACDEDVMPLHARVETVTDMADLDDVYTTERHLLYVACTRARDHLLVTGVDPASEFLDDFQQEAPAPRHHAGPAAAGGEETGLTADRRLA